MPDDEKKEAKKSLYWTAATLVVQVILTIVLAWYATKDVPEDNPSALVIPIYAIAGFVAFFEIAAGGLLAAGTFKENDNGLGLGIAAFVGSQLVFIVLIGLVAALFAEQGYWSTTSCIVVGVILAILTIGENIESKKSIQGVNRTVPIAEESRMVRLFHYGPFLMIPLVHGTI